MWKQSDSPDSLEETLWPKDVAGTLNSAISSNDEGAKVRWDFPGNWKDRNVANHLTDDKLTMGGLPAAAVTTAQLKTKDGDVELKVDVFIRRSVPEAVRPAVLRAEMKDHVADWIKWGLARKAETASGQHGTSQKDLKNYLNDHSQKRGGIPLNSKFKLEQMRQIRAYDFPYFPLSIPGPHHYRNFSDQPLPPD